MTARERLDRDLPDILDGLAAGPYPDYIDDVLTTTAQRRQRPSWTFPERWLPMEITSARLSAPRAPWRTLAAVALIAVLIVAAVAAYVGSQRRLPAPFGQARAGLVPFVRNGDIYAGDPSTGSIKALLVGDTVDLDPVFSRDGSMIGFRRLVDPTDDSTYRWMAMNADGSDVRVLTADPVKDTVWSDWSADGRSYLVLGPEDGVRTLTSYPIDASSAPIVLVDAVRDGVDADTPSARAPAGDELVFRGMQAGKVGVWVVAADGTNLHALIPPTASQNPDYTLREPQYSPDGSRIAFQQWDDRAAVMRLYVMLADGTDRRELGADPGIWFTGWPVWSNDGTKVAVQRGRRTPDGSSGFDLPYAIIDVATGSVTETGPVPGCCRIAWAPDDSSILLQQDANGSASQWLLDPAGGPGKALPWPEDSWPNWQRLAP